MPVWLYPPDRWRDPKTQLGAQHDERRAALTAEVERLSNCAEFRVDI